MFRMGRVAQKTTMEYPVLSRNVPQGIGTYCTPELELGVADLIQIGLKLMHNRQE